MTPGRNDPCPCGSGKKYKMCCLVRDESALQASAVAEAVPPVDADLRKAALDALTAYSIRQGLAEQARPVAKAFSLDRPLPEGVSEADVHFKFYFHWHFDAVLSNGRTIVEAFLESAGRSLPARQRALLERLSKTRLRLYEVQEVRREEGLRLLDLRSSERVWVRERSATRQLERWDVLAARIAADEDGVLGMEEERTSLRLTRSRTCWITSARRSGGCSAATRRSRTTSCSAGSPRSYIRSGSPRPPLDRSHAWSPPKATP